MQFQTYSHLDDYLTEIRAQGRYLFTVEELKKHFDRSDTALSQNLLRLKNKGEIALIRQDQTAQSTR